MDALHIVITFHLAAITELLERPFQGNHNHRETQVREFDKFFHVVVPVFEMFDNRTTKSNRGQALCHGIERMKTTSSLVRVPTVSSGVVRPLTKFGLQSPFKLLQSRPALSQGRFSTTDGSLAIVLGLKLSHILVSDNRIKLSRF